jgi:hypothetical protein
MHALGMKHEQSRTDRDENIKILTNNIRDGKVGNFNKGKTVDTRPYELSIIYQLVVSFIGGGNRSTQRKPPTRCKSLTKFHHIMFQVHLTMSGILTLAIVLSVLRFTDSDYPSLSSNSS